MSTLLVIVGVIVLGFVVNVALKQSYNFIFFMAGKPFVWVGTVAVVAGVVWALSAAAGWGVSVPAWACTIAFFMNLPPGKRGADEDEQASSVADEIYSAMGIKHGRLLYRLGLAAFFVACLASWVLFYGEICSNGECRSIVESAF